MGANLEPPRGKTGVGRRHAIQYREQIQAKLRASRRCSDCVHLFWGNRHFECDRGRWYASHWGPGYEQRKALRTAASCDDYEEVDDSEEGVSDADS